MKKFVLLGVILCWLAWVGTAHAQNPLSVLDEGAGTIPSTILAGVFQIPDGEHTPDAPFVERWIIAPYDSRQPVEQSLLLVITYPDGVYPQGVTVDGTNNQVDAACILLGRQIVCVMPRVSVQNSISVDLTVDYSSFYYVVSMHGTSGGSAFVVTDRITMRSQKIYLPYVQSCEEKYADCPFLPDRSTVHVP